MKFKYNSAIVADPSSDDFILMRKPEMLVTISTSSDEMDVEGLVDTGADYTIFPMRIARELGIHISEANFMDVTAFDGHPARLYFQRVKLRVADDVDSIAWEVEVAFYDYANPELESVLLGQSGFLEYFIATFDGENAELELKPTNEMLEICSPQD